MDNAALVYQPKFLLTLDGAEIPAVKVSFLSNSSLVRVYVDVDSDVVASPGSILAGTLIWGVDAAQDLLFTCVVDNIQQQSVAISRISAREPYHVGFAQKLPATSWREETVQNIAADIASLSEIDLFASDAIPTDPLDRFSIHAGCSGQSAIETLIDAYYQASGNRLQYLPDASGRLVIGLIDDIRPQMSQVIAFDSKVNIIRKRSSWMEAFAMPVVAGQI
ncbi:MAG: hypothetical protein JXK93_07125, partial [Sphaerochaetaceae bacterium]|nr:hypothetical protein [Sphaerochaetaceae bacterium]